jgi:XTP/dITP diphosphohydrolase
VLATQNRDKIREIIHLLSSTEVEILTHEHCKSFPEVRETGESLEENALLKARRISEATGHVALADDTGLEVDALDGAPGVFSARFAGPMATYADNVKKLLEKMVDVPDAERGASFRCVAAVWIPEGPHHLAEGITRGVILREPAGESGFGYDPVFFVPSLKKTYAQLSLDEKNAVSHRAQAMRKAAEILRRISRGA